MEKVKKFLPLIAAALALIAIFMIFAPSVVVDYQDEDIENDNYAGTHATFGWEEEEETLLGTVKYEYLKFSFMNLLTYILLIGGIACAVVCFIKNNDLFAFIAGGCFLLAGIFFFCAVGFTIPGETLVKAADIFNGDPKECWVLGAGAVISAILSILASAGVLVPAILKKVKKG